MSLYHCCDDVRRAIVRTLPDGEPNGIDHLEVLDALAPPGMAQRLLRVTFVRGPAPALAVEQLRIEGGHRIRDIAVTAVAVDPAEADTLVVTVDRPGDFSTYTLRLVDPNVPERPPAGIDPALASIDFSFKVECDSDLDCLPECTCVAAPTPPPNLDYLAKDEATLRRTLLDRFAQLVPTWSEAQRRNPADLGVTLLELFAHLGDRLSYRQDAVATEATLRTARRRTSVRRHVRLVDYRLHEGCNARIWTQILVQPGAASSDLEAGTALTTLLDGLEGRVPTSSTAVAAAHAVFETMHTVRLVAGHERLLLHTWHGRRCCLARGATSATLSGHWPELAPGMFLLLAETKSPLSGLEAEADSTHRHVVRLASVKAFSEPGVPLVDPVPASPGGSPTPITEIEWHVEDALPFELCISAVDRSGVDHEDVGVALGNIVLADHGRTVGIDPGSPFAVAPQDVVELVPASCDRCEGLVERRRPQGFQPSLPIGPVVHADPAPGLDGDDSAASLSRRAVERATAQLTLLEQSEPAPHRWQAMADLLDSRPFDRHVVLEIEHDGSATVRFGDGTHGRRPGEGAAFGLLARVGGGSAGNVGADVLRHVFTDVGAVIGVRNWLPAEGGMDRESVGSARLRAPVLFRRQERAVTAQDYVDRTMEVDVELGAVRRAAATFRWTGSWHTIFVTPELDENARRAAATLERVRGRLERTRLVGHDVDLDAPVVVGIELGLHVCAAPEAFRADVARSLAALFSAGSLPDGRDGLFHPRRFGLGRTVHLSPFVAAAQAVPGVASVQVLIFRRVGGDGLASLETGEIALDRLELARLDNDPSFPERGRFELSVGGGR